MASTPAVAASWGRINGKQRWRPLALDVGRAIAGVNWPAHCQALIFYIIEESWAPYGKGGKRADAVPVQVNFNALARRWGIPKQRVSEAKLFLLRNHVLIEQGDGYLFNKRADEWGDEQPLLTPEMLACAIEAQDQEEVTPQRDTDTTHEDPSVTPQRDTESRHSVTTGPPQRDSEVVPPDPHSGTGRAIEISEDLKDQEEERADDDGVAQPPGPDQERRNRLVAQAEAFRPLEGAASKIDGFLAGYPIDYVETAFMAASLLDSPGNIWRYMHKCLQTYKAQGGTVDPARIPTAKKDEDCNGGGRIHAPLVNPQPGTWEHDHLMELVAAKKRRRQELDEERAQRIARRAVS